ncbi:hypothetical protein C5B94_04015 [Clavibacter michiganensis]|uniref:hypothetical protein n=1 Tax=Clavibacter michiganensis TaxID=28447 RepID=UPI000CE89490|nr:hypothetical protein [Clavibacter michiganensis]PPF56095.1 hypothetical protein C5B94_04015 [Clavibacter michiganensis]
MRPISENLREALTSSFSQRLIVDAFYGSTRTQKDIQNEGYAFTWDAEAEVSSGGSVEVVHTDPEGRSFSPSRLTDVLAPFGQELNTLLEFSIGDFRETIQLGHFRITAIPDAADTHFTHNGVTAVASSRVKVTLEDRMVNVRRNGISSEQSPKSLASTWAEIQRLSGMQVIRTVPDKPIPATVIYGTQSGGRLKAVQDLAAVLGGVAYATADGALAVRSDDPGPVAARLRLGERGTIIDAPASMESESVYNHIVGNFETADRQPLFAETTQEDGALSVHGPYGRYTREVTSKDFPFVSTPAQARAAVAVALRQSTSSQTYRVPVTCVIDPSVEVGDTVSVERPTGGDTTGRVVKQTISSSPLMQLELEVTRGIS